MKFFLSFDSIDIRLSITFDDFSSKGINIHPSKFFYDFLKDLK